MQLPEGLDKEKFQRSIHVLYELENKIGAQDAEIVLQQACRITEILTEHPHLKTEVMNLMTDLAKVYTSESDAQLSKMMFKNS